MNEVETIKYKLKRLEIKDKELLIIRLKELIKKIVSDSQEVDYNYIENIISFLVEFGELSDYITDVNIVIDNIDLNMGWGLYYPKNLRIDINLCNIKQELKKSIMGFNDDLKRMFLFERIFITCFHEIEHANQIKTCIENKNTLETVILRNSMTYLSDKEWELELIKKGYNSYELPNIIKYQRDLEYYLDGAYSINPSEHLAEVKSSFIAFCIFSVYFSKYPYLKRDLLFYLYDSLLSGYDKHNYPTKFFIEEYSKINELDIIEELAKGYNPMERAAYGLLLDKKEKNRLKQKRKSYYLGK